MFVLFLIDFLFTCGAMYVAQYYGHLSSNGEWITFAAIGFATVVSYLRGYIKGRAE